MSRLLYRWLLWLHPPRFRQQFAEEMLWIFDEEAKQDIPRLFADGLVSLARQWLVRSGIWKLLLAAAGALVTMAVGLGLLPALRHGFDFIKLDSAKGVFTLIAISSLLAISLTLTLCVIWFRFLRRLRA